MSGCVGTPGEGCGCDCGGARLRARQAQVMDEVVAALLAAPQPAGADASGAAGCDGMPAPAAPELVGIGVAGALPRP